MQFDSNDQTRGSPTSRRHSRGFGGNALRVFANWGGGIFLVKKKERKKNTAPDSFANRTPPRADITSYLPPAALCTSRDIADFKGSRAPREFFVRRGEPRALTAGSFGIFGAPPASAARDCCRFSGRWLKGCLVAGCASRARRREAGRAGIRRWRPGVGEEGERGG